MTEQAPGSSKAPASDTGHSLRPGASSLHVLLLSLCTWFAHVGCSALKWPEVHWQNSRKCWHVPEMGPLCTECVQVAVTPLRTNR